MKLKERVDKTFDMYGEEFLINGINRSKGFFQCMDSAGIRTYFSYGEQDSVPKSALVLMSTADAVVAVGDSVDRMPRTYTVARLSEQQVRNTVVMRILLLV